MESLSESFPPNTQQNLKETGFPGNAVCKVPILSSFFFNKSDSEDSISKRKLSIDTKRSRVEYRGILTVFLACCLCRGLWYFSISVPAWLWVSQLRKEKMYEGAKWFLAKDHWKQLGHINMFYNPLQGPMGSCLKGTYFRIRVSVGEIFFSVGEIWVSNMKQKQKFTVDWMFVRKWGPI